MKTKEFMNGIAGMSMAELNDELVAAKKEDVYKRQGENTSDVAYNVFGDSIMDGDDFQYSKTVNKIPVSYTHLIRN